MHPLSNIRSCATGKRCLSAFYGTRNPQTTERCSECGYYHEIKAAKNPAENKPEVKVKTIKAIEVRPLDVILIVGEGGSGYETVTGFNHSDGVVEFIFSERKPLFVAANTPVHVVLENKEDASLSTRRNDSQLAEAVETTARTSNAEKKMGDDFGYAAFDWMEGAIRMLKGGEWAEQQPKNSMLADMEAQIGELVASANRYAEVQPKFRAAVRTLESLGYSYPVEGAEQWRPAAGDMPDFIQWEKAMDPGIIPPAQAQVVAIAKRVPVVHIGGVLGAGLDTLLLSVQDDETGDTEEVAIKVDEYLILPYDQERVMRAENYASDMREDVKFKYTPQQFKNGLIISYRDALDKVE